MKGPLLAGLLLASLPVAAASQSADELAEAAANPLANLISVPFSSTTTSVSESSTGPGMC